MADDRGAAGPDLHPLVVAAGQGLFSVFALVAFSDGAVRTSRIGRMTAIASLAISVSVP